VKDTSGTLWRPVGVIWIETVPGEQMNARRNAATRAQPAASAECYGDRNQKYPSAHDRDPSGCEPGHTHTTGEADWVVMVNFDLSGLICGRIRIGVGRRRRWSVEAKGRVGAESYAPGAVVSEVARRHQIAPQHLFAWRKAARSGPAGFSA
jgi:Transposase